MSATVTNLYAQRDYSEKRNFHRMRVNSDISISIEGSNEWLNAHCLNLSGTGLMLRTETEIPEGITCITRMPSGSDSTPDLEATIRVIRCSQKNPEEFLVGAEITRFA